MALLISPIVLTAMQRIEVSFGTTSGLVALASAALASALIVAGTFVKTMVPLRWLAVGSNVGFIACGALLPSLPMLALHGLLLPINVYRAAEMARLSRRVNIAAARRDSSGLWLRPYMKRRRLATGEVVFRKGDRADKLYLLAEGRIELVEIGQLLLPGRMFGELAFFAPDRSRTLTARATEPGLLLSIDEVTLRQLYYQNPEFGFELIGLVAGRLHADIHRLEQALAAGHARS
ncbi:MAG: cyclic nucleotide-binding domain-containing protein [Burkholderiales bacterium]|nr:cyclic nucleotide-binding domain-containing protein [Burkholderiales bacterium]MDE2398585.1 cyclic nucleotide-binding domain-containing protein [Burkholderiales bacterium]MDE2452879.1 cyclic nucleotide-binding domain-containing protein [Burkholderiales bacterium]